jgi:hypothetical protein
MHVHKSSCKESVIIVTFQLKFNLLNRFSKKYINIKFHENHSVGTELFSADGRKDGRMDRHTE